MNKVTINGKTRLMENGEPLKPALLEEGFNFPCGGNGRCGRCKIICNELKATALDGKFLNEIQLVSGLRLACDKVIDGDLNITYTQDVALHTPNAVKLSECRIAVSLGVRMIDISIIDDKIVETVSVPNPCVGEGGISGLKNEYSLDREKYSKLLRGVIGKNSVELFESYSTAKADTLAIGGSELFIRILLGIPLDTEVGDFNDLVENDNLSLPTETVYFLPSVGEYFGGELLSETIKLPEKSLFIDCEEVLNIADIAPDDTLVTSMWDFGYSDLELKTAKAAILTLTDKLGYSPCVYLYGAYASKLVSVLDELEFNYILKRKTNEGVADACLNLRTRAKLNRERKRCSYIDLLKSELFQEFLLKSAN